MYNLFVLKSHYYKSVPYNGHMCCSLFNGNKMASQISKYYFDGTLDCILLKINSIIKFLALNRLEPKDLSEENRSGKGWDRCT